MNKLSTLPVVDNAADIVTVSGIDLAKNLFAIHGTNAAGKTVLVRPRMRRHQLLDMLAQLPLCIIGMEACSGAHQHQQRSFRPGSLTFTGRMTFFGWFNFMSHAKHPFKLLSEISEPLLTCGCAKFGFPLSTPMQFPAFANHRHIIHS